MVMFYSCIETVYTVHYVSTNKFIKLQFKLLQQIVRLLFLKVSTGKFNNVQMDCSGILPLRFIEQY